MQIIIAILLIGNYGLMDIFMLKGIVSKYFEFFSQFWSMDPWFRLHTIACRTVFVAQVVILALKPRKVPLGEINWFYWVILGLFLQKISNPKNEYYGRFQTSFQKNVKFYVKICEPEFESPTLCVGEDIRKNLKFYTFPE